MQDGGRALGDRPTVDQAATGDGCQPAGAETGSLIDIVSVLYKGRSFEHLRRRPVGRARDEHGNRRGTYNAFGD